MQVVAGDKMYLVAGSGTGEDDNTYGFMMIPVVTGSNISSPDADSVATTFILDVTPARAGFLAAVKALFDDQTYTDGTNSITITSPTITEISQTSTDVTP
jgi:hypothetical protein